MRFTKEHYEIAIRDLQAAMQQIEPDGNSCAICEDSGHMAFECGRNPLLAMAMCEEITEKSSELHDALHHLIGFTIHMGVQSGPAKVVSPRPRAHCRECNGVGIVPTPNGIGRPCFACE